LKNLLCYRIVNTDKDKKTILVKIESNPISPKTEIEDALNGKLFFETLVDFRDAYPELENIIKDINEPSEVASYYALDLSPSKQQILDNFFNADNNKFDFANRYVAKLTDAYQIPDWIDNLKKLY
jgi:hypothetical protein